MSASFVLETRFEPKGDQPRAIAELVANLEQGVPNQVLLGATGTGKTFTMAQVVAATQRPALVMAPNKTLAAQLYSEFKTLFPNNAVEYFVSYYDYYQPEAYLPRTDTYIEKDASINDDIDRLRHGATHSLLTRRDVLIVASVSCIYGLGSREYYEKMVLPLSVGLEISMDKVMERLVEIQYDRNDHDFHRGVFRVRGDVLEIIPAYSREAALRIEFFGDEVEALVMTDPLTGEVFESLENVIIFPAGHYVSDRDNLKRAVDDIRTELQGRLAELKAADRLVEEQRLRDRTLQDLEMIEELGYCTGIENYSRHLDGRKAGMPPFTLLDYFPDDFILFMDESHISVPQVGGMYNGDRSRKSTLVDFGFRLPSALDNRPLNFRRVSGAYRPDRVRVGHAGCVRVRSRRGRGGGADHPAHGSAGPGGRSAARQGPGGRPAGRMRRPPRTERTGPGHHPDQAHGRRPHGVHEFHGRGGQVPALGHRHLGAGGDHQGASGRRIRRAGGHQLAARGIGHP